MARKKSVSNQSARREEIVDYDVKRLRQMSAKELQDYYDRVEPLSDDEVNAIYDRVMPKIAYEIASDNQQKKPRHIGSSIKKTVLVAICMTLMLSVVAQALGIPVWEMVLSWTQEHLIVQVFYNESRGTFEDNNRQEFTAPEKQTWGDDVCLAFRDLEFYPPLPRCKPEGLSLVDLFYMEDELGGLFVHTFYMDSRDNYLTFVVEKLPPEQYNATYDLSIERDLLESQYKDIDGISYYYVTNNGENTFVWGYNDVIYTVYTSIPPETVWDMLESIQY